MRIAFRTDASIEIGTGHVMRCLTLAEALSSLGHHCLFICRDHRGNLAEFITAQGFSLHLLSKAPEEELELSGLDWNDHASWLGVSWRQDARETSSVLKQMPIDWLVVDHYALDACWEQQVSEHTARILVIDDLADRPHRCNLLLDQTFGRKAEDYQRWVSEECELLCGSRYALLRSEFTQLRTYSLQRRSKPALRQLLITMGGVDKDNVTGQVLGALQDSGLPEDCKIVVVMGRTAPWLSDVRLKSEVLPWATEVKVGVDNMAELMAESDLAIGAAGATAWERSCLGLPSIMVVVAENQKLIAKNLSKVRAAQFLDKENIGLEMNKIIRSIDLSLLSNESRNVCDGYGVARVKERICAK